MKSIHRIKLYGACLCVILGLTTARDGLLQAVQAESQQLSMEKMSAEDFFNRGVDKIYQEDYEGAIEDFTQAIRLDPNNASIYYYHGLVYYFFKDDWNPIEDFNRVIQLYKQRMIEDLILVIPVDPNNAEDYYRRAGIRYDFGDTEGAIDDYTQMIRINPNDTDAYRVRGLIRSELGDKQGAIDDYTQVIRINPNDTDAYQERELIRSELGDAQDAEEDDNRTNCPRFRVRGIGSSRGRSDRTNRPRFRACGIRHSHPRSGGGLSSRVGEAYDLYAQALDLIQRGDKTGALTLLRQAASLLELSSSSYRQAGRNISEEVRQRIRELQQQQSPPRPLQTSP